MVEWGVFGKGGGRKKARGTENGKDPPKRVWFYKVMTVPALP